ncbi:hypothetical protein ABFS82_05G032100 [Erythranthe guttata]|uniref:uncharacterized protein LOC105966231 n=1 Tax=Erythranthe guttata TaxID=4155 RepID=UPI00064D844E|nr:PREDICTED: uncharacterized protein LOC105966231 [Erythranthe guttata]|eukprot:XP_012846251.1 PREDICTED: uncharacterized protein LOC105966231 [Erythranthe guttata]
MEDLKVTKRGRGDSDESELDIDSPAVKRLRENLLDGFDEDAEFCTETQDLDSFMKSFEEEITASPSAAAARDAAEVVDLTSDSGESLPDFGYLLEASDDELGIPPTASSPGELESGLRAESDSSGLGSEFWEIPNYDPFGLEFGESVTGYTGEYVALDGLFDYSDLCLGPGDFAWRPETLPAQ